MQHLWWKGEAHLQALWRSVVQGLPQGKGDVESVWGRKMWQMWSKGDRVYQVESYYPLFATWAH